MPTTPQSDSGAASSKRHANRSQAAANNERSPGSSDGMEELADQLLDRWSAALETRDSKNVVALYAANAVLLPTMAPGVFQGHDRVDDYFSLFLKQKPRCSLIERCVFGDRAMLTQAGIYGFRLTDPETGAVSTVEARFTFVYRRAEDNEWRIVHHHSPIPPTVWRV